MEYIFLAARGRGIAKLIEYLSHLSIWGWIYLGASITMCIALYHLLQKFVPLYIRKITRLSYPFFSWVAIPQYNISIVLFCFCLFLCFLGYFSEASDDIIVFGGMGFIYIVIILWASKFQHSFMLNQNDFYISRFALLGKYRKIAPHYLFLEEDSEKKVIRVKENGKKLCKIRLDMFSVEAQKNIRTMLKESKWTSI